MKGYRPIYIFEGYYDTREECYGPCTIQDEDYYLQAIYYSTYRYDHELLIDKYKMKSFEKDKIIIHNKDYVYTEEAQKICTEEVKNPNNKSEEDLIKAINKRIDELNTSRTPEYKEKQLLNKINELYSKVKGVLIKEEVLHSGKFLKTIKETYLLPNNRTVAKEKIVKNNGKNAVVVIAKTDYRDDEQYIVTFQQRMNDTLIAEFPSGYIEDNESPVEAAKRELEEETGYTSDHIKILDKVYTSPGIDNSMTYIVYAQNCYKTGTYEVGGTELVNFGLFTSDELRYIVRKDIMSGAVNKLAYYRVKK